MTDRYLDRSPSRGPRLAFRLFTPPGHARGAVLLTHGYAEHMDRYRDVVESWAARGLLVVTYDLRGHGRSGGPRGHVVSFRDYVRDAEDILDAVESEPIWRAVSPPVLFGHSLGGLISTHLALARQSRLRALAMTSPFFGLGQPVPGFKRVLGRIMSRVAPRFSQPSGLRGADMTHDSDIAARYDADPMIFGHVTARWFTEVGQAQQDAMLGAPHLRLPLFCLAAGADRVVSTEATRRFIDRAGSEEKELRVLEGLRHEVLNELDRDEHIATLGARMLAWVGG